MVSSQIQISGKILNSEDQNSIVGARILDSQTNEITYSNENGNFSIVSSGKLVITAVGYKERIIEVSSGRPVIIYLQTENTVLDEVTVLSSSVPRLQRQSAQSVSRINSTDLNLQPTHNLADVLNNVSGVYMQSATLNTNKITIRGIGARNLFGTANIRAYFGDIPLTNGNGESAIEDLELLSLSSIEILKGPSSSTYGVGLGGTILLSPKKDYSSNKIMSFFDYGSFNFTKSGLEVGLQLDNSNLTFLYTNTNSDGYRVNNRYNRNTYTATSNILLSSSDDVTLIGSFVNLKGGLPSSLSKTDFQNSPESAAFSWGRSKAYEKMDYGLLGVSWNHQFNSNYKLKTSISSFLRDNYEPRPFNILKENSNGFSVRSRFLGSLEKVASLHKIDFSVGGELFYDKYKGETFENLYEMSSSLGSVEGDQISGLEEQRSYFNIFGEVIFSIREDLRINAGANLNFTRYKIKDIFLGEELPNQGKYNFKPIISPKLGFSYDLNTQLTMFSNVAHGFSTPTTAETLLPEGQFNPNLKPEIGWNYEIGLRYIGLYNRLSSTLSFYNMDIKNILVSRRTPDGNFFAINAGKALLRGAEFETNYLIRQDENYRFYSAVSFSLNDYSYKNFVDGEFDFSENVIPGVPASSLNLEFKLISEKAFYGRIAYRYVGNIAVNDANADYNSSFQLVDALLGYKVKLAKLFDCKFHLSVNNFFNEKYASQVQVNAVGFGDNEPRFYFPGLPINGYIGTEIQYSF